MPRIRRRRIPVVGASIHEANRCAGELAVIGVVEAGDVDRAEIAAEDFEVPAAEGADPAVPAEEVVPDLAAELVVRQSVLAGDQPKRLGLDEDAPISRLGAD